MSQTKIMNGFSLAELIVVIAIIVILLGISIPAVNKYNLAGQTAQVKATISTMLAQATARSSVEKSGLLVMRARKHPQLRPGPSSDPESHNPALEYQEIRLVIRKPHRWPLDYQKEVYITHWDFTRQPFYRDMDDTLPTTLPKGVWIAPTYVTNDNINDNEFSDTKLVSGNTHMFPAGSEETDSESLVNAFFILFHRGKLIREYPGGEVHNLAYSFTRNRYDGYFESGENIWYNPDGMIKINHPSARGIYVYNREDLRDSPDRREFLRQSEEFYFSRCEGDVIGPVR